MRQSIDRQLGRDRLQGSDDISAGDFHSFFDKKVGLSDIRARTDCRHLSAELRVYRLRFVRLSAVSTRHTQ